MACRVGARGYNRNFRFILLCALRKKNVKYVYISGRRKRLKSFYVGPSYQADIEPGFRLHPTSGSPCVLIDGRVNVLGKQVHTRYIFTP